MDVVLTDNALELTVAPGDTRVFDNFWLRDNCPSAFHPDTAERVFDILSVPNDLRIDRAQLENEELIVQWADDQHASRYPLAWLLRFGASLGSPLPMLWRADIMERLVPVTFNDALGTAAGLENWLTQLTTRGFSIMEGCPLRADGILDITGLIGPPQPTNFGTVFDVVSKQTPNNNAYTAIQLFPHSDLPNWRCPPDFQFLYCLENDALGGESVLVDGFSVADALRVAQPDAFDVLTRVNAMFRFHDETADIRFRAPVIGLDETGAVNEIRLNPGVMGALDTPGDDARAFYLAYRQFVALTRDPTFELTLSLAPGDMLGFDNLRVLHGRCAFDPSTGARHLRGCYVERDFVLSKLRLLTRDREIAA
ncbi:MAG: TauD/TfdA family dioxygenase [Pseudomonadota bacterium]